MFHMLFPEPFRGISGGLRRSGSAWQRVSRGRPGGSVCARPSLPQCLWRTQKSRQCGDGDRDIQNGTDLLRMGMFARDSLHQHLKSEGYVFESFSRFMILLISVFLLRCFSAYLLFAFCFSLLLCFDVSLLLRFSASPLFCFFASSPLCFSTFPLLCFFASLLLHCSASAFCLLLCLFASWTQTNSKTNPK